MKQLEQKRVDLISEAEPNLLVARALDGCQDCYSELATRYFPRLVQLVLPRVSSRNLMDAEDVAQESLKRAFENLATFDPQYRFTTWLYTIAIRIAIDHNRHYRRRATLLAAHRELAETHAADDRVADHACESVENAERVSVN